MRLYSYGYGLSPLPKTLCEVENVRGNDVARGRAPRDRSDALVITARLEGMRRGAIRATLKKTDIFLQAPIPFTARHTPLQRTRRRFGLSLLLQALNIVGTRFGNPARNKRLIQLLC